LAPTRIRTASKFLGHRPSNLPSHIRQLVYCRCHWTPQSRRTAVPRTHHPAPRCPWLVRHRWLHLVVKPRYPPRAPCSVCLNASWWVDPRVTLVLPVPPQPSFRRNAPSRTAAQGMRSARKTRAFQIFKAWTSTLVVFPTRPSDRCKLFGTRRKWLGLHAGAGGGGRAAAAGTPPSPGAPPPAPHG